MNLRLNNIGIIKEADVAFEGLTVIAGKNDTGKSTVGKLLFAIIKAISRQDEVLARSGKLAHARMLVIDIYHYLRRHAQKQDYKDEVLTTFDPFFFFGLMKKSDNIAAFVSQKKSECEAWLEKRGSTTSQKELLADDKKKILAILDELKDVLLAEETRAQIAQRALQRTLTSEFHLELCRNVPNAPSMVKYSEGAASSLEFYLENNKILQFNCEEDLIRNGLFFKDVTLIETPVVVQMHELIRRDITAFNYGNVSHRPAIQLHIKDLINKIEAAERTGNSSDVDVGLNDATVSSIVSSTISLISGNLKFDKKAHDFLFSKGNNSYRSINTATGIKSFGIIQLLVSCGAVGCRQMLIIDEPEVHLHPEWQVEYARLLVELVKNDVTVVVSSHSPYFIQALKVFSDSAGIKGKANFYLAEKNEDGDSASLSNVSNQLDRIFKTLTAPLVNLVWK